MNKTLTKLNISILKTEIIRLELAIESCKNNSFYKEDDKHILKLEKKVKDINRIISELKEEI